MVVLSCFFFSSRRRHTIWPRDWSSDVCSSDLEPGQEMFDNERPTPKVMSGATAAMIAFSLVLTVAAGPIMTYADEAAQSVLERTPYVGAVLDDEAAGDPVYRSEERRVGRARSSRQAAS